MRGRPWIVLGIVIVVAGGAGWWISSPSSRPPKGAARLPVQAKKRTPVGRQITLGRVAQADTATNIYSNPSKSSHQFYKVAKGQFLVVREDSAHPDWRRVLLQNRQYGYAPAASITLLDYEYKVPENATRLYDTFGQTASWEAQNYSGPRLEANAFVKEIYTRAGNPNLPVSYDAQLRVGKPVKRLEDLKAGDRVYFWSKKEDRVGDAGIYEDRGYFARLGPKGVETLYLGDKRWMGVLVAARR